MRFACCLLLLAALHLCEVRAAIWSRNDGQQQVTPLEISMEGHMPQEETESAFKANRLFKRQSPENLDSIGYTARLRNDHHLHGLVHWTGYPSEVLFMLTRNTVAGFVSESWLWRSTDYGHTFSNDTVLWDNNTIVNWYYIAPLSEYLIFADITHRKLWVTRDEGETYTGVPVSFAPNRLTFQSRFAPGSNSTALAQYVLGYDTTRNELWVSTNLGSSWERLGQNVTKYSWRVLGPAVEQNSAVYYEKTINATHSRLYTSTFPYTSSRIFDENLPPFLSNSFVLSDEYMFVQLNSSNGSAQEYSSPLWVSRNRQPFRQASFPLQSQERHYAVVDTSEGQVFIGVFHDINNTHLYMSEVEGLRYSLSLMGLVSPPEQDWVQGYPEFDLHVVEGLVGTFIANTRDPSRRFGSTVISYDKGGNWALLRAPTLDRFGGFIDCQQPNCSLHLHIQASRDTGYQSILTQDSAIGLIMATGNLGNSLVSAVSQYRQYFSRDGGFTWLEVDSGYRQFQFAGLGAIVTSVTVFTNTDSVKFSCNEGSNWTTVSFLLSNQSGVRVVGMLTEPGERALHVTVFGIRFPFSEWLVIGLNFTSVVPGQCTPHDFFTWVPTDDRPGSRCLLGESITYERRRSEVCCFIDPRYNRPVSRSLCTCTQEDFECDFGFERIELNSPCTPLPDFQWPPLQPTPCPEGTTYNISSGYRKVAGDRCVAGEELSYFPIQRPCILGPPNIISLQAETVYLIPQRTITFTIIQTEGGMLNTEYRWDFNDSHVVTVVGYQQARLQIHRFARPKLYNVTVLASNRRGSAFLSLPVTIVDPISSVSIVPPAQLMDGTNLPVDTQLLFGSEIDTEYNTSLTGPLQYSWNFGSAGTSPSTQTATYTFPSPSLVTVTLSVFHVWGTLTISDALAVNVLDRLTTVELVTPAVLMAGEELVLNALLSTQFHSTGTGQVNYTWGFGDEVTLTSTQPTITYTFPSPANYTVALTANNAFSRATVRTRLLLLDQVQSVEIVPPAHTTVATSVQLVFAAHISTLYNTSVTGLLLYSWDFGDGSVTQPSASAITSSHTYTSAGTFTVQCRVLGSRVTIEELLQVVVFEAADSDSVEIVGLRLWDGEYVLTQQMVTLHVEEIEGTTAIIPPDTTFRWTAIRYLRSDDCPPPVNSTSREFNLTFACWGQYSISVTGRHFSGSFNKQLYITAESNITTVEAAELPDVLRSGIVTTLTLLSWSQGAAYKGPLTLSVQSSNGSTLASTGLRFLLQGSATLTVQLSRDNLASPQKRLTILASNDVSSASNHTTITLAVRGQYGEARLFFQSSQLPDNYNSTSFLDALKDALESTISEQYHLPKSSKHFLDIESYGFLSRSVDLSSSSPALAARTAADSGEQQFFYVDVNIMPASLLDSDIQAAQDISAWMVSSGSLQVMVNRTTIHATVELRSVIEVQPPNRSLYVGLGVGLGTLLLVVVVLTVILVAAVTIYRRNYRQLNVRYSRLRQTPVRFTFTQEGEMVEDDDYEPPHSSDEEEEMTAMDQPKK